MDNAPGLGLICRVVSDLDRQREPSVIVRQMSLLCLGFFPSQSNLFVYL